MSNRLKEMLLSSQRKTKKGYEVTELTMKRATSSFFSYWKHVRKELQSQRQNYNELN